MHCITINFVRARISTKGYQVYKTKSVNMELYCVIFRWKNINLNIYDSLLMLK